MYYSSWFTHMSTLQSGAAHDADGARPSARGRGAGENDNETLTHTDLAPGRVVSQDEVTRLESGAKRRKSGLQSRAAERTATVRVTPRTARGLRAAAYRSKV